MFIFRHGPLLLLLLVASAGGNAQAPAEPPRDAEPAVEKPAPEPADAGGTPSTVKDRTGFLPIPIIVTEPAVGYGAGAAGLFLRQDKEAGGERSGRPDISAAGALKTQNGTKAAFAGDATRWPDSRLHTLIGAGTGQVNLDFYGLGNDSASLDQKVSYSLEFTGVVAQVNWQLAPKSPWAVGLRYVYAEVQPKLRDVPLFPNLIDDVRATVSAPTAIVEYDTRDNMFTPTSGVYAETSLLAAREALGSSVDFSRLEQVAMGWLPLPHRVTLGARGNFAWSSSDTPFFLRPFIQLRGVPAMRYQGDKVAALEMEGRWQFHDQWSGIAFGGVGAARTQNENFSRTQSVGSGGLGIRYRLAKLGMDVGLDVASSPGTTAVYLVIGSAWVRP